MAHLRTHIRFHAKGETMNHVHDDAPAWPSVGIHEPADQRSPIERIADMRAADMNAATAAPFIITAHGDDLRWVNSIAAHLGDAIAARRWLADLVERLMREAETAVRYAEATEAQGTDVRQKTETAAHASGFTAGVNHLADALQSVMTTRPVPPTLTLDRERHEAPRIRPADGAADPVRYGRVYDSITGDRGEAGTP